MATPTSPSSTPATPQHETPGVGKQGDPPKIAPAEAAKPVLFDDIDPILLIRLYPGAKDVADLHAQAMKAGQEAHDLGAKLIASQQEPVLAFDPDTSHPLPHTDPARRADPAKPHTDPAPHR